tara:strand:- start:453 stop:827 length:375 start_codon:yes stop_codon:yes gene_type:complete
MPTITLNFNHTVNPSPQIGDNAWYIPSVAILPEGGFDTSSSTPQTLGVITNISQGLNNTSIAVTNPDNATIASVLNGFFMYSRDQQSNISSIKGYYAELNMINDDITRDIELFRVGVEVSESSK